HQGPVEIRLDLRLIPRLQIALGLKHVAGFSRLTSPLKSAPKYLYSRRVLCYFLSVIIRP
ncbi:MAG: hypothetical protein WCS94_13875, partial [Verrucomicrobiota bacterium]